MRKMVLVLSAVTSLAGVSVFLSPATAHDPYPSCEAMLGKRCSGPDVVCQQSTGDMESMTCFNGTWHYN